MCYTRIYTLSSIGIVYELTLYTVLKGTNKTSERRDFYD